MKWTLTLALAVVGCSGPVNPPELGKEPELGNEPAWSPPGEPGPDAGDTPRQDDSGPEAASLELGEASLATLPREGNVSCFGLTGQSQLEWIYQESTSTALLLVQETPSGSPTMGSEVSCALMTALNAGQCDATATDSNTRTTWSVSYNPTTNSFAGTRYSGMVDDEGRVLTTAQDFAGTCLGSWGDL
jgi:hypothetical protein